MPEGPEIKIEADKIARILEGRIVQRVELPYKDLEAYKDAVVGQRVNQVKPKGKAMLVSFDSNLTLYSHNQLYGRWHTSRAGTLAKTKRKLRVALHTDAGVAALYSASDIEILTDNEVSAHPYLAKLGPDVLDASVTPARIVARLHENAFYRRKLGNLYLDQSFLAGVGNYLRSEILFNAGLSPHRTAQSLSEEEQQRLARATLTICRRAYKSRGVVNDPARVKALKNQGLTRSKYRFAVFARQGQPCYICAAKITRLDVAARRLYQCPQCQK
ncbi:MAG: endonuclease VIII [Pseudomonadota bacterium]